MERFASFSEAVAYVRAHGRIGYHAPLDHSSGILQASVTDKGAIRLRFDVPADSQWPAETFYREATASDPKGHACRLRKIG